MIRVAAIVLVFGTIARGLAAQEPAKPRPASVSLLQSRDTPPGLSQGLYSFMTLRENPRVVDALHLTAAQSADWMTLSKKHEEVRNAYDKARRFDFLGIKDRHEK